MMHWNPERTMEQEKGSLLTSQSSPNWHPKVAARNFYETPCREASSLHRRKSTTALTSTVAHTPPKRNGKILLRTLEIPATPQRPLSLISFGERNPIPISNPHHPPAIALFGVF
jgi:hypothetical protein